MSTQFLKGNQRMEIKYLSDGRKVAVIGKINQSECIVQEIFITDDGDELPSGEKFVVKSLHEKPVKSWLEKENQKKKDYAERLKNEIDLLVKKKKEHSEQLKAIRHVVESASLFSKKFPEYDFEILIAFLTGTIEYLVIDDYQITPPVPMVDKIIRWEREWGEEKFDMIKLCSVFGQSGGDIRYAIHAYSDHSGGKTFVTPFLNFQDALDHIRKRAEAKIEQGRLSENDFKKCQDMGIEFSDDSLKKYQATMAEVIEKNIKFQQENIDRAQKEIEQWKSKKFVK